MMTSLSKSHTSADCHKLIHSSTHCQPNSEIKIIIKSLEMQPHKRVMMLQNELLPVSSKPFERVIGNANDSATFDTSLEVKSIIQSPQKNLIATACRTQTRPIAENLNKTFHYCPPNDQRNIISAKIHYRKTPVPNKSNRLNATKVNEHCKMHGNAAIQKSESGPNVTQIKIPFQNTKNLPESPTCTRNSGLDKTRNHLNSSLLNSNQPSPIDSTFCQKSVIKIQANGKMINYCFNQAPISSTPIKANAAQTLNNKSKYNLITSSAMADTAFNNTKHHTDNDKLPNQHASIDSAVDVRGANLNESLTSNTDICGDDTSFDKNIGKISPDNVENQKIDDNGTLKKCFSLTRNSCRQIASTIKAIRHSNSSQSVMSAPNSPKFERHSIFLSSFNSRRSSRSIQNYIENRGDGLTTTQESNLYQKDQTKSLKSSKNSKFLNFFKIPTLSASKARGNKRPLGSPSKSPMEEHTDDLGCFPLLIQENVDTHNVKYFDEEEFDGDKTLDWGDRFEFSYICEPSTSDGEAEDPRRYESKMDLMKTPGLVVTPPSPIDPDEIDGVAETLRRQTKNKRILSAIRRSISDSSIFKLMHEQDIVDDPNASFTNLHDFVNATTQQADVTVNQANVVQLSTLSVSKNAIVPKIQPLWKHCI